MAGLDDHDGVSRAETRTRGKVHRKRTKRPTPLHRLASFCIKWQVALPLPPISLNLSFTPWRARIRSARPLLPAAAAAHVAALGLTFGDVTDLVFKIRPAAAPGHVFQVEALIGAQHDHLDGAGFEQRDLVLSGQLPAEKDRNKMFKSKRKKERKKEIKKERRTKLWNLFMK